MKRIGIITIVEVNNYGAELQAFALQKKLELLGYDAELIDYPFYKNKKHVRTKSSKPWKALNLKARLKEFLYPYLVRAKNLADYKSASKRSEKYKQFHLKHTRFSEKCYATVDSLYCADLPYDVCIIGSDQVWNPRSNTNLDPYFLTFAGDAIKRISYASSFGVSAIPADLKEHYAERLQGLHQISVREAPAVDLVRELSGRKALHVLDPTLLLSEREWINYLEEPALSEPYILIYALSATDYIMRMASHLKKLTGYKIVRIAKDASSRNVHDNIHNVTDAGPSEYLGWFHRAAMIITDSFHGTAFSVNFNRPFFTIVPTHKTNNSRQQSLLGLLHLQNRIIPEDRIFPSATDIPVDFQQANFLLKKEKEASVNYLRNAIES